MNNADETANGTMLNAIRHPYFNLFAFLPQDAGSPNGPKLSFAQSHLFRMHFTSTGFVFVVLPTHTYKEVLLASTNGSNYHPTHHQGGWVCKNAKPKICMQTVLRCKRTNVVVINFIKVGPSSKSQRGAESSA